MTIKNKIQKAAAQVDIAINAPVRNIKYARNRAASYNYWLHKAGKFALSNGRLI